MNRKSSQSLVLPFPHWNCRVVWGRERERSTLKQLTALSIQGPDFLRNIQPAGGAREPNFLCSHPFFFYIHRSSVKIGRNLFFLFFLSFSYNFHVSEPVYFLIQIFFLCKYYIIIFQTRWHFVILSSSGKSVIKSKKVSVLL